MKKIRTSNIRGRQALALEVPAGAMFIELGVAAGLYANEVLTANPKLDYVGVDRWSDHHNEAEMHEAKGRIEPLGGRVIRATFEEALSQFEDEKAYCVYIDGYAHTGQEGGKTLSQWWSKVRPGGLFAGHDYSKDWPLTVEAVDAFYLDIVRSWPSAILEVIECSPYNSWLIRKPERTHLGVGEGDAGAP